MTAVAKTGGRIRRTRADKVFDILNYVILTFCFLIVAYPLYFIVIASISDPVDVYAGKVFLYPVNASLDGYRRIVEYKSFFTGYRNTAVYTIVGTLVNVVMTIPAAYALSRKDLVGRNAVMMMITFTMLFSGGMIPSYLLVNDLGIDNTMWALILPGAVSSWNLITAGGGPAGRRDKQPVLPAGGTPAVQANYRCDGALLRGGPLEQLLLRDDLPERSEQVSAAAGAAQHPV